MLKGTQLLLASGQGIFKPRTQATFVFLNAPITFDDYIARREAAAARHPTQLRCVESPEHTQTVASGRCHSKVTRNTCCEEPNTSTMCREPREKTKGFLMNTCHNMETRSSCCKAPNTIQCVESPELRQSVAPVRCHSKVTRNTFCEEPNTSTMC